MMKAPIPLTIGKTLTLKLLLSLSLCLSLALSTPKPGMEASCEERVESSPYFVKKFLLLRRLPIYLNCMVVAKERDCCHFVLYTQATLEDTWRASFKREEEFSSILFLRIAQHNARPLVIFLGSYFLEFSLRLCSPTSNEVDT